ncbi:MAG: hypothetical protein KDA84_18470, partial [Planctomycetaceae bacterium]|nr:hypothetical protein [Planctomycetaceae bacterium]
GDFFFFFSNLLLWNAFFVKLGFAMFVLRLAEVVFFFLDGTTNSTNDTNKVKENDVELISG